MVHRLPLFPLDVVLFPGTPLPLHIFEPRYRTMLADCLEGDERFGILPVSSEGSTPPPGSVGFTARIHASQLMADGRSNIVVVGESRFALEEYLVDDGVPYAVGSVEDFDDHDAGLVSPDGVNELRKLSREYLEALHALNDSPGTDTEFPEDAQALSFLVSAAIQVDTGIKQRLLSLRSTGERVRLLLRLMPPLVSDLVGRAGIHERARTNGNSPHHHSMDESL